jgi:hypothetical protein
LVRKPVDDPHDTIDAVAESEKHRNEAAAADRATEGDPAVHDLH